MKKLLCLSALSVLVSFSANAAQNTGPGCGLGTKVFDGKTGVAPHVLAGTTNGSSGNQTFGLSSGTSGCDASQTLNYQANVFVNDNMQQLAVDFSRGEGEALNSLVNLMGVETQDKDLFATVVRSNFADIFSSENVTAQDVLSNLTTVMRENQKLASYVS